MSLTKTFGTLAELVALAYRFKRNVFLFEACNSGTWYVCEEEFKDTFLVFYTPPRHFDSVFTKSHIETVAFCQCELTTGHSDICFYLLYSPFSAALTYEILYSRVFKLPDVIYAVERMLHDPEEGTHISQIEVSPYDEFQETLKLSDGRYFILDHPGNVILSERNRNRKQFPLSSRRNGMHFEELFILPFSQQRIRENADAKRLFRLGSTSFGVIVTPKKYILCTSAAR